MLDDEGGLLKGDVLYDSFIKKGILPQAMLSYMVSSGYGDPDTIYNSIDAIVEDFDYKKVRQNNGKFDFKKLVSVNRKIFSGISVEDYSISLRLYSAKINREDMQFDLNNDIELISLFSKLKIPFEKTEVFYDTLNTPDYSGIKTLDRETRDELDLLIKEFKLDSFDYKDFFYYSNKSKIRALKFFLIGDLQVSGGLVEITEYLISKKLISKRLEMLSGL
jgi:glutamyl/glutaminyl-tRNA synthetase